MDNISTPAAASDTRPTPPIRRTVRRWGVRVAVAISMLVIALFLLYPPISFDGKAWSVGRAVCHQFPSHSFTVNGQQLPLCARCTGIYLGAIMGLAGFFLLGRQRSVAWSPTPVLAVLVSFIVILGVDGINAFLHDLPNVPSLYEPQNWLRLITGTFHGLAMIAILMPVVNETLWHPTAANPEPVIKNFRELAGFVLGGVVIILLVLWRPPFMLYPLTFFSSFGVVLMLTLINSVFAAMILRREGSARTGNDIVPPLILGLALAILIIWGMNGFRSAVGALVGAPI